MTRQEKQDVIQEITDRINSAQYFYITDTSGLSVGQVNTFREKCFKSGVEYKVYKNTLIQKAFEQVEGDFSELQDVLKGFSGIMWSPEVGNAPAKVIKELRKQWDKPVLKGASIDTAFYIGDEHVKSLSELKSKDELIGEVISLLQSPAKNVISSLQSGKNTLAGLVKTLSEREQ
jgi:large subunit ribosomal protein L10